MNRVRDQKMCREGSVMGKEKIIPKNWKAMQKYAAGYKVSGGSLLVLSGKGAVGPDGAIVAKGDMAGQTRYVMETIRHMLESGGATLNDVIKTTIYVKGVKDFFPQVWDVYASYFEGDYPAATLVGVTELAYPDLLIEIDVTAFVPEERA
jgi:enamine deaminase RidA (YjgF/YER057c/UK114 family)